MRHMYLFYIHKTWQRPSLAECYLESDEQTLHQPSYDVDPVHHSDVTPFPGAKSGPRVPCSVELGLGVPQRRDAPVGVGKSRQGFTS